MTFLEKQQWLMLTTSVITSRICFTSEDFHGLMEDKRKSSWSVGFWIFFDLDPWRWIHLFRLTAPTITVSGFMCTHSWCNKQQHGRIAILHSSGLFLLVLFNRFLIVSHSSVIADQENNYCTRKPMIIIVTVGSTSSAKVWEIQMINWLNRRWDSFANLIGD